MSTMIRTTFKLGVCLHGIIWLTARRPRRRTDTGMLVVNNSFHSHDPMWDSECLSDPKRTKISREYSTRVISHIFEPLSANGTRGVRTTADVTVPELVTGSEIRVLEVCIEIFPASAGTILIAYEDAYCCETYQDVKRLCIIPGPANESSKTSPFDSRRISPTRSISALRQS